MRRLLIALAMLCAPLSPAHAAGQRPADMTASSPIVGTQIVWCPVGTTADFKCTFTQIATFINSLFSGDFTVASGGAATLATVNSNVGSFGSATQCTSFTTNGKGLITAASQTACTPAIAGVTGLGTGVATALGINVGSAGAFVTFNGALGTPSSATLTNATGLPIAGVTGWGTGVAAAAAAALNSGTGLIGALTPTANNCMVGNGSAWTSAVCPGGGGGTPANPTATAGPTAINGVATTYMRSDAAPAVQQGSSSQKGIVQVDGTTITESGGVISTAPTAATPSLQTGSNYAFQSTDRAKVIYLSNASPQVPTIAQAGTGGFTSGWFASACNIAAGTQTITPATSTIGGSSTFVLPAASAARPACVTIISDGSNYYVYPDFPMDASMFSAGTVAAARLPFGTGVGTAAAANLSAAGGLTSTIASGTASLGTGAISSATCASVVTVSATNTATTDVVLASFNGDPTAVTGYMSLTSGMLTIIAYPTANNVNFKVCNNTGGSITPGAITLNWRVVR